MGVRGGIGAVAAVCLDLGDPYGDHAICSFAPEQGTEQARGRTQGSAGQQVSEVHDHCSE
jgi:hypothetical protein